MGTLELHFHDSDLSWHFAPGTGRERSFSLGTGGESKTATNGGATRPSVVPKLKSLALLALFVAGGVAFNRMKARRRERAEQEAESSGRRLSLLRSK